VCEVSWGIQSLVFRGERPFGSSPPHEQTWEEAATLSSERVIRARHPGGEVALRAKASRASISVSKVGGGTPARWSREEAPLSISPTPMRRALQ